MLINETTSHNVGFVQFGVWGIGGVGFTFYGLGLIWCWFCIIPYLDKAKSGDDTAKGF